MKFLDDTQDGVHGALARYASVVKANHRMYVGAHRGALGPFKRWLQSDLGVFSFEGRIVGTTHSVMAQLGFAEDHLAIMSLDDLRAQGPVMGERARVLGQYIAAVSPPASLSPIFTETPVTP
jgi:hypothetical protein